MEGTLLVNPDSNTTAASADPLLPVLPGSPWPLFRRDHRNSGRTSLVGESSDQIPWCYQTGKGIFSTPVIDQHGCVYFGSADQHLYVLEPDGELAWKFATGGIIDSAAALSAADPLTHMPEAVTVISGDGLMYRLRIDADTRTAEDRILWTFQAEQRPDVSFNRWWEGNVALGFDGTLYAGNTNFLYYAVSPTGDVRWTYPTGSNNWSMAAFGEDGTIFWGSNDTFVRAVSPHGREIWRRRTLGFISASAAVGSDGTVYIGSFDSNFYALDPHSGRVRWKFATNEHIYSSAALGENERGETNGIYFGSADGCLYALDPEGNQRWRFDAGAPIRSSPAIGLSPEGEELLYFGCGNGILYALSAAGGALRWAFDTTPDDPLLRDRNDLNGSPALGEHGVYIGGEHGQLWYVPYDYPLRVPDHQRVVHGQQRLPDDYAGVLPVTPGAAVQAEFPPHTSPATIWILRLTVRENGRSVDARVCNNPIYCPPDALDVKISPDIPHRVEHSADGRLIYIIPETILPPGKNFHISVTGRYYTGGWRLGNLALGGRTRGRFKTQFSVQVEDNRDTWFPLTTSGAEVSAFEWTRLSAALPPMLPSLNQIGFDEMDWIVGTALLSPIDQHGQGRCILWALDGRQDDSGMLVANPQGQVTLALSGTYQGDAFILNSQRFELPITGIKVPFNHFELRGRFSPDLSIQPGPVLLADTQVLSIPNFGPKMVLAGLANDWFKKLLVLGTYLTRPYPDYCPANREPEGVRVSQITFQQPGLFNRGWIEAELGLEEGCQYRRDQHRGGMLLVDPETISALPLDYHNLLRVSADRAGNLKTIRMEIPRGTRLPQRFLVIVMLDVFPIHREFLFL